MKKPYNKVLPIRILSKETYEILQAGADLDHVSNGKISTFMRNAGIDKAKKLVRDKNK